MSGANLSDVARRYVEARDEVTRLEAERAACVCDFEPREVLRGGMLDYDPPLRVRGTDYSDTLTTKGKPASEAPCWAWIPSDGPLTEFGPVPDAYQIGEEEGWCDSCRRRQELHEQLGPARRRRTSRLSALISCTRATVGPPKPVKPRAPTPPPRAPAPPAPDFPWDEDMPF